MPKSPVRSTLSLLTLAAVLAAPAFADPDDDGDWSKYVPPAQSTGTVTPPNTSEGGFGSPDRTRFDEKMRARVLDQLCRTVRVKRDFVFGPRDFSGTSLGLSRQLGTYPDGMLAIVDDEHVRAAYGRGVGRAIGGGGASVALSLSGAVEGHTMVVRRLKSKQTCDEVGRMLNFSDIKTVIPMSAQRISQMELGELWRVPFTLTYGQGVSASDAPSSDLAASVSFGRADAGAASMTLYRIADDKVRFRFRIDHVVIYSQSLGIRETIPAIPFATDAHNILLRFLEKQAANQLDRYISAWLSFSRASSDGTRMVMEFVIDPRDPAQAEAMSSAMRGDLEELVKMGARMSTFHAGDAAALKVYGNLRDEHAETLDDPAYAASNQYRAKTETFSLNLPFFIAHNSSALFGDDKVSRQTGEQGEYRFYRADKSRSNEYFNMPFIGTLVKENSQRDVEAVTYAPPGGPHGEPIVVYLRNQGYLRVPASSVRETVDELNGFLKLAGAQRGGAGGSLALPADALVPPSPPSRTPGPAGVPQEPSDRKGLISFTLVFNQKAVRDALSATAPQVLKALASAADPFDKPLMDWLVAHASVDEGGALRYSVRDAGNDFPRGPNAGPTAASDPQNELASLSRRAAGVLADLAAARGAKTNEERAEAVARMIGGKGESGLAYEDILKVLVQFVDPLDLTGDLVASVSVSTKGVKDTNEHLVLKKGRSEVPLLKDAGDTKSRFAEPSILTD